MGQPSFLSVFILLSATLAAGRAAEPVPVFSQGARVLVQGDSITDGNRGRNTDPNHILGHGYVFIVAANFAARAPERGVDFMNRGISGNNVTNLAGRWQKDTLDLKPDVLSILIGINDALRVPIDQFETVYDRLIADTLAALPKVKLVLCEPFTLPIGKKKENWETWSADVKQRQAVVIKLAEKHRVPLVRFQKAFDEACKRAPAEHWIWDGVHPTYAGHQIMADEWVRTVNTIPPPTR